jgi:transposase
MPLAESQREVLEKLARSQTAKHRDVQRAKALLLAAEGVANTRIGADLGVSPTTVVNWRERFRADGLKGIGVVREGRVADRRSRRRRSRRSLN